MCIQIQDNKRIWTDRSLTHNKIQTGLKEGSVSPCFFYATVNFSAYYVTNCQIYEYMEGKH